MSDSFLDAMAVREIDFKLEKINKTGSLRLHFGKFDEDDSSDDDSDDDYYPLECEICDRKMKDCNSYKDWYSHICDECRNQVSDDDDDDRVWDYEINDYADEVNEM